MVQWPIQGYYAGPAQVLITADAVLKKDGREIFKQEIGGIGRSGMLECEKSQRKYRQRGQYPCGRCYERRYRVRRLLASLDQHPSSFCFREGRGLRP